MKKLFSLFKLSLKSLNRGSFYKRSTTCFVGLVSRLQEQQQQQKIALAQCIVFELVLPKPLSVSRFGNGACFAHGGLALNSSPKQIIGPQSFVNNLIIMSKPPRSYYWTGLFNDLVLFRKTRLKILPGRINYLFKEFAEFLRKGKVAVEHSYLREIIYFRKIIIYHISLSRTFIFIRIFEDMKSTFTLRLRQYRISVKLREANTKKQTDK